MRILFALPGLHRYSRGAEVAFTSVATALTKYGDDVTLIGSGDPISDIPYRFVRAASIRREAFESFPTMPPLRSDYIYEELTFAPSLLHAFRPRDYDVTLTCSYPFTNWILRRPTFRGSRPPHVFVTQNGDWPAFSRSSEYRLFACDGLICTNPDFYDRNHDRWQCALIPNGVDGEIFHPGPKQCSDFGLPSDRAIVLMVSALIPTKRVIVGIEALSKLPNAHLVVAGDGPLREIVDETAQNLIPGRFTRLTIPGAEMPALYRCADVCLHLSKYESFGNVFVEAMATGIPVVAHATPPAKWILGDDEFLIDTEDMRALIAAIDGAVSNGHARRNERLKRAAELSWDKVAQMYRAFLTEIVASGRRAAL